MLFLLPTALAMSPEAAEVTPPPPRPPPVEEEAAEAAASSCRVELCRVFRTPTGESLEDTAPAERWKNLKKPPLLHILFQQLCGQSVYLALLFRRRAERLGPVDVYGAVGAAQLLLLLLLLLQRHCRRRRRRCRQVRRRCRRRFKVHRDVVYLRRLLNVVGCGICCRRCDGSCRGRLCHLRRRRGRQHQFALVRRLLLRLRHWRNPR